MTPDLKMYHSRKGCRFDFARRDGVVSLAPFGQELPMKTSLATLAVAVAVLLMLGVASAQQKTRAATSTSEASVLEAKVRKAWEDFKTKNKAGFAADLTEDFHEVEDDGDGLRDKKTEVAEIDQFDMTEYKLHDFHVTPIGSSGALVNYAGEYRGSVGGQPAQQKAVYGEVWVRHGNGWKLLYVQETKVK
jgi:hypothetical protein